MWKRQPISPLKQIAEGVFVWIFIWFLLSCMQFDSNAAQEAEWAIYTGAMIGGVLLYMAVGFYILARRIPTHGDLLLIRNGMLFPGVLFFLFLMLFHL